MQFKINRKYLSYMIYFCITIISIFLCFNFVFHFNKVVSIFFDIVHAILILFKPLIIGIVIAYLLYPLTKYISRFLMKIFKLKKEPHLLSITLTYILVVFSFIIMIYASYSMIVGEIAHNKNISSMVDSIKSTVSGNDELFDYVDKRIEKSGLSVDTKSYLSKSTTQIGKIASISISGVFKFSKSIGSTMINGFLGLCISFYLLKDYEYFKKKYVQLMQFFIKEEKLCSINKTIREIDDIFANYIRGTLLDALIVGVLCSIGLSIVGMDFAILIGFIVGLANIIPYVGPFCSNIPVIIVGLLSPHPIVTVWAMLVLFIVHKVNSLVISPKVVGSTTGHNPVFVIIAVFVGGSLWGILGILLSVPILGIIKLFMKKFINVKQQSTI